jgi:hypothetical protein
MRLFKKNCVLCFTGRDKNDREANKPPLPSQKRTAKPEKQALQAVYGSHTALGVLAKAWR